MDAVQKRAFDAFCNGESIALIGSAGSGKSFLINKMLEWARRQYSEDAVISCAFTNSAAESIAGSTIHNTFNALPSWRFTNESLLQRVLAKKATTDRIMRMKVLVIDEIFQLKACELDAIEYVVRVLTHSERDAAFPFARRQIIISGDPLQLEPVKLLEKGRINLSAYEGRSWHRLFGGDGVGLIAYLTANHRQKKDRDFFELLTRIRGGRHTQKDMMSLNYTSHGQHEPSLGHVRLCLQKKTAKKITMKRLGVLRSQLVVSRKFDTFSENGLREVATGGIRKRLDEAIPQEILLKQGARVMLTRKIRDLLPGTICVVQEMWSRPLNMSLNLDGNQIRDGLQTHKEILLKVVVVSKADNATKEAITLDLRFMKFEVYRDDGTILATRFQLPVIPAYALTVHRSQGLSFDQVAIDFSEVRNWMPAGGAYVALSRCRSKSGLWVKGMHQKCVVISPRARAFEKYIEKIAEVHPHRIIRNNNSQKIWRDEIPMPTTANALCVRSPVKLGEKRETENMGNKDVYGDVQDIQKHWKKHRTQ